MHFILQNSGNAELPFSVRNCGFQYCQNVFEVGNVYCIICFMRKKRQQASCFDVNGAINCTTLNQSSDRDL